VKLAIDSLAAQKWIGLVFLALGVFWWMYVAITDTKGAPYRAWSRYVNDMELQLRSMFIWTNAGYIATVQAAISVTLLAGYVLMGSVVMLVISVLALVVPPLVINAMVAQRRDKIDGQASGFAGSLANALKSTASIGDALASTVALTPKPLVQELELALKQMRLGSSLPDALLAMSARVQAKALDICVSTLLVGRQSGGDLPTILERTSASLRELKRLEELTAKALRSSKQGFLLAVVLNGGMILYFPKMLPIFFGVYHTPKGELIAAQLIAAFCVACYLGYRFTRTDI
jgi:tight adherence protein B